MSTPAGRLPPQAPSSRLPPSSYNRAPSGEQEDKQRDRERSSRSGKSKSRRHRSSSDGVRTMNERYQQQQQQQYQQYYGGGGVHNNNNNNNNNAYPVQHSNQPPPQQRLVKQSSERSMRTGSFDAGAGGAPFGMDPNSAPGGYGSIPPPRTRTGSKEFCAMSELNSVIGRSGHGPGGSSRGMRSPGKTNRHRRTMSDSMAMRSRAPPQLPPNFGYQGQGQGQAPPQLPPNFGYQGQGAGMVMPNPDHQGNSRMRADSHGSQMSHHSYQAPPGMGVYTGNEDLGGENDAFLNAHMGAGNGGAPGGYRSGRPKMHMRQHSVNLYMKSFKGEVQTKSCKDILFAVLFVVQLVVMCAVGLRFGPEALVESAEELGPSATTDDMLLEPLMDGTAGEDEVVALAFQNIVKMAYTCGAFAIIVSALALAFMMTMSRRLVYVALVLSIGVSFAWGTIGIGISPKSFVPITGIIALMLTVGYMFVVWDRIPFASANLATALTGVRDNLGLVGVAFFFQFLALVCSIYYSFAFVGLHDAMYNGQMNLSADSEIYVDVLLLLSYYWTYQVLRHIVMVTVAGTIGSWWFNKPSSIKETFVHAIFYNFGSICYGSLFVGMVQFLRQITEGLRPNRDDSAMMCLHECSVFFLERLVSCVDSLADSFTPWAFTYVGLYHYGLKEAGHKANELFDRRGWARIVTDDLISNVLAMVSLVIGGLCGSFAVILQALDGHGLTSFGHPVLTSFIIGFMVGIVLSTVLFGIIESSVNAVIVCFAGNPVEFQRNYPELSNEMRQAWKEVWPGSLDVDNAGGGTGLV